MYKYKKRPSKLRKIITLTILIIIVAATSIFIYDMYMNIDVYSHDQLSQNEGATRVSYIEGEEDTNKDITQILENTEIFLLEILENTQIFFFVIFESDEF